MRRALILVDHGSILSSANDQLRSVAEIISQMNHEFDIVRFAHMELSHPTIEESFDECVREGAQDITVHPYFLAPGRHSTHDIPKMVVEAARKHPGISFRVTKPLGIHEKIIDVVLERAREVLYGT